MNVSFVQPRQELRPYIKSFWVCESAVGMPEIDRSLAAPNGCPKLIVPHENSLESIANGRLQVSHEQGLYFVGNRDSSTLIRSSRRKTGFIGIEFSPHGAFPLLGLPMQETVNGLFDEQILAPEGSVAVGNIVRLDKQGQPFDHRLPGGGFLCSEGTDIAEQSAPSAGETRIKP